MLTFGNNFINRSVKLVLESLLDSMVMSLPTDQEVPSLILRNVVGILFNFTDLTLLCFRVLCPRFVLCAVFGVGTCIPMITGRERPSNCGGVYVLM